MSSSMSFLTLPSEIRNEIYAYLFTISPGGFSHVPVDSTLPLRPSKRYHQSPLGLLRTNRQIHDEATGVFYGTNRFLLRISHPDESLKSAKVQSFLTNIHLVRELHLEITLSTPQQFPVSLRSQLQSLALKKLSGHLTESEYDARWQEVCQEHENKRVEIATEEVNGLVNLLQEGPRLAHLKIRLNCWSNAATYASTSLRPLLRLHGKVGRASILGMEGTYGHWLEAALMGSQGAVDLLERLLEKDVAKLVRTDLDLNEYVLADDGEEGYGAILS